MMRTRQYGIFVQQGFVPVIDDTILTSYNYDPVSPTVSTKIPLLIGTNKHESENFLRADPKIAIVSLTDDELKTRVQYIADSATDQMLAFYKEMFPQTS